MQTRFAHVKRAPCARRTSRLVRLAAALATTGSAVTVAGQVSPPGIWNRIAPALFGFCSNAEPPQVKAATDPFAGAPSDWDGLLAWAAKELGKTPAPVPVPAHPKLAAPKWP